MSVSTDKTTDVPHGYPLAIAQELNNKFLCSSCKFILKLPVQNFCGHRFCRACIDYIIKTTNGTAIICPACKEEEEDVDLQYHMLKVDEVFADNAIKREMQSLKVTCTSAGCSWAGKFKDYENHYEECEYLPIPCSVCKQLIPRRELAVHQMTHLADKGCPYGCTEQVTPESFKEHVRFKAVEHIEIIRQRLATLETTVTSYSQGVNFEQQVTQKFASIDQQIQKLSASLNETVVERTSRSKGTGEFRSEFAGVAGSELVSGDIQQKLKVFEDVLTVLNSEMEKLYAQLDTMEQVRNTDKALIDTLESKVKGLERQLAIKDATIAEANLAITSLQQASYNGTLLWKVTDFSQRRQDAISGRAASIYSPAFYTSRNGYKMCARMYLNGDGMGKGTHISLFFVIMRGQYDALLKWPFQQKVSFMFIDQNSREHVIDRFQPDATSSSFKRPTSEMNIASGCPLFLPLVTLDSVDRAYVKDNTAFVKVIVSTEGLDNN